MEHTLIRVFFVLLLNCFMTNYKNIIRLATIYNIIAEFQSFCPQNPKLCRCW